MIGTFPSGRGKPDAYFSNSIKCFMLHSKSNLLFRLSFAENESVTSAVIKGGKEDEED